MLENGSKPMKEMKMMEGDNERKEEQ